jgi:hypothetical protein
MILTRVEIFRKVAKGMWENVTMLHPQTRATITKVACITPDRKVCKGELNQIFRAAET